MDNMKVKYVMYMKIRSQDPVRILENSESFMKHVNTNVFVGARTGPTASLVVELM